MLAFELSQRDLSPCGRRESVFLGVVGSQFHKFHVKGGAVCGTGCCFSGNLVGGLYPGKLFSHKQEPTLAKEITHAFTESHCQHFHLPVHADAYRMLVKIALENIFLCVCLSCIMHHMGDVRLKVSDDDVLDVEQKRFGGVWMTSRQRVHGIDGVFQILVKDLHIQNNGVE